MDSTKICVLEKPNEVGLRCLLKSEDGGALVSEFLVEVAGDLPDEPLERKLPEEEVGRLLISSDLSEGDGARPESVGLLDASSGGGSFPVGLGAVVEGLGRSLAGDFLSSGLLSSGH